MIAKQKGDNLLKWVYVEPLAEIQVTGTCSLYIVFCGCHYAVYGGIKP